MTAKANRAEQSGTPRHKPTTLQPESHPASVSASVSASLSMRPPAPRHSVAQRNGTHRSAAQWQRQSTLPSSSSSLLLHLPSFPLARAVISFVCSDCCAANHSALEDERALFLRCLSAPLVPFLFPQRFHSFSPFVSSPSFRLNHISDYIRSLGI